MAALSGTAKDYYGARTLLEAGIYIKLQSMKEALRTCKRLESQGDDAVCTSAQLRGIPLAMGIWVRCEIGRVLRASAGR
jgi:hypothetical protein